MNKVATIGTNVVELFQPEGTSEPSGLGCLVIIARHHGLELSVAQLVHDNYLVDQEVSVPELLKAARSAGLRAQTVRLDWHGLTQLDKALPAIVRLQNGRSMVLLRLEGGEGGPVRAVLQDPNAGTGSLGLDRTHHQGTGQPGYRTFPGRVLNGESSQEAPATTHF